MNSNTIELIKKFALAFTGGAGMVLGEWALKKVTHQPNEALVLNLNQIHVDKDGDIKTEE